MAIVPTQLLEFNDGTNTKGFSTLYDLKPLNAALVVAGKITNIASTSTGSTVVVGFPSPETGDRHLVVAGDVGNVVI